jgi:glycosyltransferase involved in cell wall biosynthesis
LFGYSLGLTKNVVFVGRVFMRKSAFDSSSAFLVHPSLVEGFGIVLLEAFACKKPALVVMLSLLRRLLLMEPMGILFRV